MGRAAHRSIVRSGHRLPVEGVAVSHTRYWSRIVPVKALDGAGVAAMSALYLRHYAGSSDALFRGDLADKDDALLVFAGDALIGFTTIKIYDIEWQGRVAGIVYSGDTIVDRRHWGQRELARAWLEYVGGIKARAPQRPLYWFLLVKGHRTYRYLPVFARHFYPCWSSEDARLKALADHLAAARFGADYDRDAGVVAFPESRGHLRAEFALPDAADRERADVKFFLARNPGFRRGHELVCLCELDAANLKPLAARLFARGQRAT